VAALATPEPSRQAQVPAAARGQATRGHRSPAAGAPRLPAASPPPPATTSSCGLEAKETHATQPTSPQSFCAWLPPP